MKDLSIQQQIERKKRSKTLEKAVPIVLFSITIVSVLTTIGILYTLISETFHFLREVSIVEFLTSKTWNAFSSTPTFGIFPLVLGTLKIVVIATLFAVPTGVFSAIYLSEYAPKSVRKVLKPTLEVLAGIPTVVYGAFAITVVTPMLQSIFSSMGHFNAISPGLVVGIMILPMITSLTDDAITSVPDAVREGSYGLGATQLETVFKVVLPAALSGILASIVLATSRAIGETMIVSIAAGSTPNSSFNLFESLQTMTGFIVQVTSGDAAFGSQVYYSLYAVGITLFIFTLIMNVLAMWIAKRFREEY
ncbi:MULTISPECIES: phosphate ABC transporter permease subunit PstC [Nosocomiicoccus]|uniref:Phosphate transport system permease protein n=1 Tax=Nosocomiicoccus massiliensis TaxID=1232430 RepID=A0AAF0YIY9_9STAP|nr:MULTISPECIES: phosphate ABC transporter permease subunit PstC [Nosocomiicoccus]MDK6862619.1 phosphate ABC transporter permease subunit PstC [Nosocomiicoccus ampullae]OFL47076.1 phosphate ABC transporter permease subunit PstC [Nosocomiicoccus sp. HMSC067E10]OFS64176.1 phosphate ABC transporter permease subunit PstC [Nosocomiicoccus sp. HMSC09A07]WOS96468.1 phosphate ABC transporter permease subunit PstC [Nosocomiicoccus massiliensis]